ncbi:vacuolar protein sorting-associated protein 36 [Tanacetum coccineum]
MLAATPLWLTVGSPKSSRLLHDEENDKLPLIIPLVQNPDALQSGVSTSDAARILGIASTMANEHLLAAESKDVYFQQRVTTKGSKEKNGKEFDSWKQTRDFSRVLSWIDLLA